LRSDWLVNTDQVLADKRELLNTTFQQPSEFSANWLHYLVRHADTEMEAALNAGRAERLDTYFAWEITTYYTLLTEAIHRAGQVSKELRVSPKHCSPFQTEELSEHRNEQ
jgi:hypothetical protein